MDKTVGYAPTFVMNILHWWRVIAHRARTFFALTQKRQVLWWAGHKYCLSNLWQYQLGIESNLSAAEVRAQSTVHFPSFCSVEWTLIGTCFLHFIAYFINHAVQ